jgi:(p)ppGpp synthase/HD superfamily hydrolase
VAGSRSLPSFVQGLPLACEALHLARAAHEGQRCAADGAPFICHPLAVAELLFSAHAPDEVIAAGLLHDTLEKSEMRLEHLQGRDGSKGGAIVAAVSEDPAIPDRAARERALSAQVRRSEPAAALVFAADKIAKLAELRDRVGREGEFVLREAPTRTTLEHYAMSADVVESVLGSHVLVLRLRADLSVRRADAVVERPSAGP